MPREVLALDEARAEDGQVTGSDAAARNEGNPVNDTAVTKQTIIDGLDSLGLTRGDTVLVHSSLSSFGHVEGGANTVIDALIEIVGVGGTVMVPTLTGSAELSSSNPPVFDARDAKCWTGVIPETFRQRPEALRSLHPTHSVAAIGPKSACLAAGHEESITPCGESSPYYRLAQLKGYVLMLGIGLQSCTLFHTVEELAGSSYVIQDDWVVARVTDLDGNRKQVKIKIHLYGPDRDFPKMEAALLATGAMKMTTIGCATVRLIAADQLLAMALDAVRGDPDYLLA